jgi:phospholipase A1
MKLKTLLQALTILLSLSTQAFSSTTPLAENNTTAPIHAPATPPAITKNSSSIDVRAKMEDKMPTNYFAIAFYKPTYVLPYYFTQHPYNSIYNNNTPDNEHLKHTEAKYQLSFKVPIWKNILGFPTTIYLGYTQLSYWQAYNHLAFFRSTDYEPEVFVANEVNFHLFKKWNINFLNVGAVHQSNGFGNELERSWNRIYLQATLSDPNWMISIKPWLIIQDHTYKRSNPDIGKYLGYGQIILGFKHNRQTISLSLHNIIESGGRRATAEFNWSFPINTYLKGYAQVFTGYGQSLVEYNHRTMGAGIGLAFNDWI